MSEKLLNVERDINIHLENKSVSRHYFIFLFLMYSVVYMTKNCFSGALADIVADGVMTKSQTGLITSVFYLVYAVLQIPGGIVADKFSPELLVKIGLFGSAIANGIIFFNHDYHVMLIVWTLNSIVQFALWPATYKIITSQLCRSDKSYMIFFISMASTLGLLMSYVAAAILPRWELNFALSSVALLALALIMHIYDRHLNKYMKKDYEIISIKGEKHSYGGSTFMLFLKSGFFLLLIPVVVRCLVGQGSKTLAPIMLFDTFATDPSFGNLMNVFIIVSGLLGTLAVRLVLYPRYVKNELVGYLISILTLLVASSVLIFANTVSATVITMCVISMFSTAATLFVSYFNAGFAKYGKNGTAAGISNAAASIGIVITNYGLLKLSELFGWHAVRLLWVVLLLVSAICISAVIFINRRFKKSEEASAQ